MSRPHCSIDEMEKLLGQLQDFEDELNRPGWTSSPAFRQEYRIFRQYLAWRIEDFNKAMREEINTHITGLGQSSHNTH